MYIRKKIILILMSFTLMSQISNISASPKMEVLKKCAFLIPAIMGISAYTLADKYCEKTQFGVVKACPGMPTAIAILGIALSLGMGIQKAIF